MSHAHGEGWKLSNNLGTEEESILVRCPDFRGCNVHNRAFGTAKLSPVIDMSLFQYSTHSMHVYTEHESYHALVLNLPSHTYICAYFNDAEDTTMNGKTGTKSTLPHTRINVHVYIRAVHVST